MASDTAPSSRGIASCSPRTAIGWLLQDCGRTLLVFRMGGVLGVVSRDPWPDQCSSIEAPPEFSTSLGTHPSTRSLALTTTSMRSLGNVQAHIVIRDRELSTSGELLTRSYCTLA